MNGAVAGAPVSFGVFELTPEGAETVAPEALFSALHDTGYTGIDLGPVGYLGRGAELRERLDRHGLALAGGWVQLPFTDDAAFAATLPELDAALAVFVDAASAERPPRPTLADAGSAARAAAPGRGAEVDPLDDEGWNRLVANLATAIARIRGAGLEPTFHHHASTYVESPEEVDRLLDRVDIGLTLDVGHLALAGGDPVDAVARWGDRIDHLHLKDVDTALLGRVLDEGGGMREVWSSGVFTAFGSGDLDLAGVLDALDARGFDGWVVVEQDVLNARDVALDGFLAERTADQRINRDALRRWL